VLIRFNPRLGQNRLDDVGLFKEYRECGGALFYLMQDARLKKLYE
jgi:hypothetical protein